MVRILIIDDDDSIRSVLSRYLERNGYAVDVAENGEVGLKCAQAEPPDLVITDVMMPEKDGLEVAIELRKMLPSVPLIAISGGMRIAPMDFLPMMKRFGARRVLYKPVDFEELLGIIKEELAQ